MDVALLQQSFAEVEPQQGAFAEAFAMITDHMIRAVERHIIAINTSEEISRV